MLKDKQLTSLHDSLFAKFKNYALSKEQMRQVRGGVTCESGQIEVYCTVSFAGGGSTSGYGCAETPLQASDILADQYNEISDATGEPVGAHINCSAA